MRTETVSIYKFDELPEGKAKERAREIGRQWVGSDPHWSSESVKSIQAFCDYFGVTLKRWSVGAYEPVNYSTDADNANFRERKLREFNRDYMPTGYCLDCNLWGAFYDYFKRTGDAKGAFDAGLESGFKAWRDDLEHQLTDEYIDDFLTINEYEFDEYGNLYR